MPRPVLFAAGPQWRDASESPCDFPHRCSRPSCPDPAVLVIRGTAHAWDRRGAKWTVRRWICADHAVDYGYELRKGKWWWRVSADWSTSELLRISAHRFHHRQPPAA